MTAPPAAGPLDLLDVATVLAAIAKAAPDLTPVGSFTPAEVDIEVPDQAAAARVARLLDGIRTVRGTALYDRGWGGTIAGVPVRVLVTRTRRGSAWAAA